MKFSTYAVPMISGEIKRFLRDDGMIKVSRSLKELSYRIFQTREKMTDGLGREPTLEELSQEMGVEKKNWCRQWKPQERLNLCIVRSIKRRK